MSDPTNLACMLSDGWGLPAPIAVTVLKEHRVWRMDLPDAGAVVLKNWGTCDQGLEERVVFYQAVMAHAGAQGIAGERAIPTRVGTILHQHAGEAWWLTRLLPNHPTPLSPSEEDELLRDYGRSIARLHRAFASFPEAEARRQTWRKDLHGDAVQAITLSTQHLQHLAPTLQERWSGILVFILPELERLRGLPEQLIFYDCHQGNVLRDGARVTGFVDGNHISIGLRIWDLCYLLGQSLGHLHTDQDLRRWVHHARLLVEAYAQVSPLGERERDMIWIGMMAARLERLAWALGRQHLDLVAQLVGQLEQVMSVRNLAL